jgi:AbrB family looped-hinge helix DNA binding protein
MSVVTISPKFQVVIPKQIRDSLGLKSGQKVEILQYEGRMEMIPIQPLKDLRGFLKGIKADVGREPDRV